MTTIFKTSPQQAQQMAYEFYQLAPSVYNSLTPTQQIEGENYWATQIQQDGSHTAYLNFANGIAKQHGQAAAQELLQNTTAYTQQNGMAPWTPAQGAVNGQLPGTNTKSGGTIIGAALTSPIGQLIETGVAGVLDVVSGGAATPWTTAGLGALQAGGTALQPGNNFGSILKSGLTGAAEGGLAGAGAGLFSGVTGIGAAGAGAAGAGSAASSAIPNAASMNPSQLADIANAGSDTIPDANSMNPGDLANVANASSGDTSGGSSTSGVSGILSKLLGGSGSSSLLSGLGGAANAYTNYQNEQQQNAIREAAAAAQQAEYNRSQADTEGMDAASLQRTVNDAPVRDKAQALIMARLGTPPTAFQPRDITHGNTSVLNGSATGGIGATLNAVSSAGQNYTPGAGGTNVDVDKTLINRFMNPTATVTPIPGGYTLPTGQQYPNTPYTPTNTAAPPPAAPTSTTAQTPITPVTPTSAPAAPATPPLGTSANPAAPPASPGTPGSASAPNGGSGFIADENDPLSQYLTSRLGGTPQYANSY